MRLLLLFFLFTLSNIFLQAQNYSSITMPRGGIEKTSIGQLRCMFIFIRYANDYKNTEEWPDYNVLPNWAFHLADSSIPSNNIFYPENITDYFSRASGGNGKEHIGKFTLLGDVFYVTTKLPDTCYNNDQSVIEDVIRTLDSTVDFSKYDNWKFQHSITGPNHINSPDSLVDQIFFLFRGANRHSFYGAYQPAGCRYTTNDGTKLNKNVGVVNSKLLTGGINKKVIGGLAHEFCHFLFSGGGPDAHWDGRTYIDEKINEGRINMFAIECGVNAGYIAGFEKYILGWINPTIVENNRSNIFLKDTHIWNDAILIPIKYDSLTGWLKEYYFIENYQSRNSYPEANPFLNDFIFEMPITQGLLLYHIAAADYLTPCKSKVTILCADGKWKWSLLQGSATPWNRNDDIINKDISKRIGGFDERQMISIPVGDTVYNDYMCLTPELNFPGSRYNRNAFLGDDNDFFRVGGNTVFSKYSNPAACDNFGNPLNLGFEIVKYDEIKKEYTLNFYMDSLGVKGMKPSKPQNLRYSKSNSNHPLLTWEENGEPDIVKYNIYKQVQENWELVNITLDHSFELKNEMFYTGDPLISQTCYYKISAIDSEGKESDFSDKIIINNLAPNIANMIKGTFLFDNYPNPFNSHTTISYQIDIGGKVSLKIR